MRKDSEMPRPKFLCEAHAKAVWASKAFDAADNHSVRAGTTSTRGPRNRTSSTFELQTLNTLRRLEARLRELGSASDRIAIPLADAETFKRCVGISPARARKLQSEGFPLRFRGKGRRRAAYALVADVADWWRKQSGE